MTGTNCDLFTHNQSRSYLNHLVHVEWLSMNTEVACKKIMKITKYTYKI